MNKYINYIGVNIFSCVLGIIVSQSYSASHVPAEILHGKNIVVDDELMPSQQLTSMQNENKKLRDQLRQLTTAAEAKTSGCKPAEQSLLTNQEVFAKELIAQRNVDDYLKYSESLRQQQDFQMHADMERKFTAEAVDYEWAKNYEASLQSLFNSDEILRHFSPDAIECRTQKCQIKLHVNDSEEANTATKAFSTAVHSNQNTDSVAIMATPDYTRHQLNIYIAKNSEVKLYQ